MMEREAREIADWGGDTYVEIPITNTKGESAGPLIAKLSREGFSLNITAMTTLDQVETVAAAADRGSRTIVSAFAGRIADTGVDPLPVMAKAVDLLKSLPRGEPIPLRLLFAAHPHLLAPVLQVIHRVISTFLIKQAGVKSTEAATGAVTLVQRFGSAANLNRHA